MKPKVFISYSWASAAYQQNIIEIADRLASDGVDIAIDVYDLKDGQDKYAFMEKMVLDQSITHVLIFCDKTYEDKSNDRKAGVGTESQIISSELYGKIEETKFIPIIMEYNDRDNPCLPVLLKTRIWIDLSSPEKLNENWERLIRTLYGKPALVKPQIGATPSYITENREVIESPAQFKFIAFKESFMKGKPGIKLYREDFLNSCIDIINNTRIRTDPSGNIGHLLTIVKELNPIKNLIIDWIQFESSNESILGIIDDLKYFFEQLLEMKARPNEVQSWNEHWFDAHAHFVYEVFVYSIATLLKTRNYKVINELLTNDYLLPLNLRRNGEEFSDFTSFWSYCEILRPVIQTENISRELIKTNATHPKVTINDFIESELVIVLMFVLNPSTHWFPHSYELRGYQRTPEFFLRCNKKTFSTNILTITGINTIEEIRDKYKEGAKLLTEHWRSLNWMAFYNAMNLDKIGTI